MMSPLFDRTSSLEPCSFAQGPLWFKSGDAAAYAYVAQNNMTLDGTLPNARRILLASGCVAVISYDVRNETANIAFSVRFGCRHQ